MGNGHDVHNQIAHYRLIYIFRFLLASLNIEGILQESTMYRRRERLNKMTDGIGLEDVYGATIERIKAQGGDKSRLGMGALMWICYAVRPLEPDELCHALAIEPGSKNFNPDNAPSISTLVSCCQGLITVDKKASNVRLMHFTLKEYLSAHPDIFSRPHSTIAEICLTYLNSKEVKAILFDSYILTWNIPFLEYCSLNWGVHAKKELSDCAKSLSLELLKEYNGHVSGGILLLKEHEYLENIYTNSPLSGLHCASLFGIVEVVAALIELECCGINEGDYMGYTPFAWAARNGHEEVVKILLEREEVNPDQPDEIGRTPLSHAAMYGHDGVVKILLEREEANPDQPDEGGGTPLSYAAWHGHEGVLQILLGCEEVNPDKPDRAGITPLSYAAWHGHEGVVKVLLEREEVNPCKPDNHGRTPLSYAAQSRSEGVVNILLRLEGVNPDQPDNNGRTPLSYAVGYKHEGVVEILLGREEVNPDQPDNSGITPLSYAARWGYERIVKILLEWEEVNPSRPDNDGKTPLMYATRCINERIIALFQSRSGSPQRNPKRKRPHLVETTTIPPS